MAVQDKRHEFGSIELPAADWPLLDPSTHALHLAKGTELRAMTGAQDFVAVG